MSILLQPYMLLLLLATCVCAALTVMVLKYRPTLGTRSFAALMSAVALWSFAAAFEVGSQDPQTKLFSYELKYFFIVIVPVAWLIFGLYYSNRLRRLQLRTLLLLLLMPIATLLMVITNEHHALVFTSMEWIRTADAYLLFRDFGPWFWLHAAYCYVLLLLGFVFLAKALIDSPSPYRGQIALLFVGGLAPWIANMVFVFNLSPVPYLDLTPFAFTVSGMAFMWGVVRYRLLDIVPIARDVVIQNMQDAILVTDTQGRIMDLNPAAAGLIGGDSRACIGARAAEAVQWWPKAPVPGQNLSQGDQLTIQLTVDGQQRFFRIKTSDLFCKDKPLGQLIVLHDHTAAHMAENALRNSEARFRSLTENAPVIIFALDATGMITYVNPACHKILGYQRHEVIGKPFPLFVIDNPSRSNGEILRQLVSGEIPVAEANLNFIHKDGSKRLFYSCAAVNTDTDGRVNGIIGMAKDITEERRLQVQLFQAQKMEAIGTLAGGIAHDFNNLLMGMQANVSLMRLDPAVAGPLQEKLTRIENQIQSGASLTRQLLGYARKGKYRVDTIDLNRLIEETLNVVQRTNKAIVIHRHLCNRATCINADRGQMELVLLNLFVNAVDAMPGGGELTVTTAMTDARALEPLWPDLKQNRYLELKIQDTGTGMDQQTMDRIFEPFFTTKEMGHGTGLGLASVYGVVKNHEGHIRVESQLGLGSIFTLLFPLASSRGAEKARPAVAPPMPANRQGTVLLVDDEELVLKYCGEMIESLGYTVLRASTGREAIEVYRKHFDRIQAVILDMVMPGMDGLQTYEVMKEIHPLVKVVISSGYTTDARTDKILSEGPHASLKKPYTREQLAHTLQAIIAAQTTENAVG